MAPTPRGSVQPAKRGNAFNFGVLHATAVVSEPKRGRGVLPIRRSIDADADMIQIDTEMPLRRARAMRLFIYLAGRSRER